MNELDAIAASFGVSEPVFKISLSSRGGDLIFDLKNTYQPPDSDDPVYKLIVLTRNETLNKDKRRFESCNNSSSAYASIINTIRRVIVNTSPLKNPMQTKLYKWLCKHGYGYHNSQFAGFIALYRYVMNNGIQDTRDNTNPHAKNVLAILELMREKHER